MPAPNVGPTPTQDWNRLYGWLLQATRLFKRQKSSTDPTTTQVPQNEWVLWENTTSGITKLWYNDDGAMGSIAGFSAGDHLTLATVQNTTSGTSKTFSGIPSTVKRITLMMEDVSTNGSDAIYLQLGDSGGIENTNYIGTVTSSTPTVGQHNTAFVLTTSPSGSRKWYIVAHLNLINSSTNTWMIEGSSGSVAGASPVSAYFVGAKALSATLTQLQISGSAGGTFDLGKVNISYE